MSRATKPDSAARYVYVVPDTNQYVMGDIVAAKHNLGTT